MNKSAKIEKVEGLEMDYLVANEIQVEVWGNGFEH